MVNASIYFSKAPKHVLTVLWIEASSPPTTMVITAATGGGHVTFLLSDGREEVNVERWVNKLALTWEGLLWFKESARVRVEPQA